MGRVELAPRCRLACAVIMGFGATAAVDARAAAGGDVAAALDYGAVSGCPDREGFEAVVESHLGYSPFQADAPRHVVVRIEQADRTMEGRVEWRNDVGGWAGERRFPSRSGDCG